MMKHIRHKILFSTLIFLTHVAAHATILWVGGEDIDFKGGQNVCSTTAAGYFRAGYARAGLFSCNQVDSSISTKTLSGGAVTSAWISGQMYFNYSWHSPKFFGLGKSGTQHSLWVGSNNTTKIVLYKYDGTTFTQLAAESGASLNSAQLNKIDIQIVNYGIAGTVKVYVNGNSNPAINFSGDLTTGSNTELDDVRISGANNVDKVTISELIVADTDTRAMSVVTLAPNAAGSTNQWTGSYSNVNPVTVDDNSTIISTTPSDIFQTNLNNLPFNNVTIQAVKLSARAYSGGVSPSSLSLGVFTNSSAHQPTAVPLSPAWELKETYYQNNPITSSAWLPAEINNLQMSLQSAP